MSEQNSTPTASNAVPSLTKQRSEQRADIQWMRALAVCLVVIYHLWPKRLPGGFVGVDVFLVISGFLISSHLLSNPPRRPLDLAVFWGRRIRRLLPASFLVIVVTVIFTALFAPISVWRANGIASIASTLYIVNWHLAQTSVDYLASTDAATALQHYWSLSVEEQFYLLWPILIAIVLIVSKLRRAPFRLVAGACMLTVVLVSLAWSGYYTEVNHSSAYFVTTTRMWELAMGGVLAALYPSVVQLLAKRIVFRLCLVAAGGTSIVLGAIILGGDSFPGIVALVPVLGASAIIIAGPMDHGISFDTILGLTPIRKLGDISYSVYLWHWPLIILAMWILGPAIHWPVKLGIFSVTLILSWLTKTYVEDRFRGSYPLGVPLRRTFIFLLIGMVFASGSGVGLLGAYRIIAGPSGPPLIPANATCVGAAIRLDPACLGKDPHGDRMFMTPYQAPYTKSQVWVDNCLWSPHDPSNWPVCIYGSHEPTAPSIALFGNSHAGPYMEPLSKIAESHGWSLRTYLAENCFPSTMPQTFSRPAEIDGCLAFTSHALQDMRLENVKTVVVSARTLGYSLADVSMDSQQLSQQSMFSGLINEFTSYGISVVVIRDVPLPTSAVLDCLSANSHSPAVCDEPRETVLPPDPLFEAANGSVSSSVITLDFTNALCDSATCWNVVGGVVVYFDNFGHLSSTFANTLLPYLEPTIVRSMTS